MKYFPQNSLSQYTIQLDQSIDLKEGEWEIALAEIIFHKSWKNVTDSWIRIDYGAELHTGEMMLKSGFYKSIKDAVEKVNESIRLSYAPKECVEFVYSEQANEVQIKLKQSDSLKLILSKELAGMVGYGSRMDNPSDRSLTLAGSPLMDIYYLASSASDINNGFYNIYVYCDLCDLVSIGDVRAPLLRIVPLGSDPHYANQWTVYSKLQYVPMIKKKFNTITIYLMNDIGSPVHFETGKTVVTVDVKRKQLFKV